MTTTCVWASRPLVELNGQTGFVECDEELAVQLIELDQVQDPRHGGTLMRYIDDTPPDAPEPKREPEASYEYDTKVMTPKRRR